MKLSLHSSHDLWVPNFKQLSQIACCSFEVSLQVVNIYVQKEFKLCDKEDLTLAMDITV